MSCLGTPVGIPLITTLVFVDGKMQMRKQIFSFFNSFCVGYSSTSGYLPLLWVETFLALVSRTRYLMYYILRKWSLLSSILNAPANFVFLRWNFSLLFYALDALHFGEVTNSHISSRVLELCKEPPPLLIDSTRILFAAKAVVAQSTNFCWKFRAKSFSIQ